MDADQTKHPGKRSKKWLTWLSVIAGGFCLTCIGLPTLIYLFFIPTLYEVQVGQTIPASAKVTHSKTSFAGPDVSYQFVIAFKDDRARDQIVKAWQLQPGETRRLYSSSLPAWWPTARIDHIREYGEQYGRIDDQAERWWSVWVDRDKNLIYAERGRW